jgi:hypothetical protein
MIDKSISRPLTLSRKEALAEAGVTPGQDAAWREARIFSPELPVEGERIRRYTELDVINLRWLKHLCDSDHLGLPIEVVAKLMQEFADNADTYDSDWSQCRYIDIHTLALREDRPS